MRGAEHDTPVQALGDRALVVALRCGSSDAVREFVVRFRPMLLLAARRLGVDAGERAERADDVLTDALLHLAGSGEAVPLSVRGYLLRSLRNRSINAARSLARRARAGASALDAAGESEAHFERAVIGCVSEHTVRASYGPSWDGPPPVSAALANLARALAADMAPEERLLTTWLSHFVPQQEIAAWLGLTYEATSKRVRRLRARLQAAAVRHIEHLSPAERDEVRAFLQCSIEPDGASDPGAKADRGRRMGARSKDGAGRAGPSRPLAGEGADRPTSEPDDDPGGAT